MSKRRVRLGGRRADERSVSVLQPRQEDHHDGSWVVRRVTGSGTAKSYRCPGCDHLIARATPHVVAWPVEKSLLSESALAERRHWHAACWDRR